MAQTIFNLAVEPVSDIPNTGGSEQQLTSAPEEKTEAKDTSKETTTKTVNTANTGFITTDSSSSSIVSLGQEPIVFGALFFIGIILFFAFIAKLKKKKHTSFKKSLNQNRYKTTALGLLSLLMVFAGIGGAVSKYIGSSAATNDLEDITTSGVVNASLVETGSDYNLYCGVDTVTINKATKNGYLLYAMSDDAGKLVSQNPSITDIKSIEDWSTLSNGTWGFKTNKETYTELTNQKQYKPLHLGSGVIAAKYEATSAGEQIKVDYCAKVSKEATSSKYKTSITYGAIALDENNIMFVDGLDYDSPDDYDEDGLTNRKETQYGTNISIDDTDMDGIADAKEINTYKTDPLSVDTDDDGISDYSEIALSLNPTKTDSKGDGIQDGNRSLTYTITDKKTGASIALSGTGDLPASRIIVNDDVTDVETSAINLYSLYTGANITSATITIPYNLEALTEEAGSDISESELVIAKYDSEEDTLTTISSSLDATANTVSAVMSDLGAQYIIADKDTEAETETLIEDVYGSVTNEDETDDEILEDSYGGILKKLISKATAKTQTTKVAQSTDCLTSANGCDSGFRAARDGFAFENYSSEGNNGHCAGMATFAKLFYEGKVNTDVTYFSSYGSYILNLDNTIGLYSQTENIDTKDTSNDIIRAIDHGHNNYSNSFGYATVGISTLVFGAKLVDNQQYIDILKQALMAKRPIVGGFFVFLGKIVLIGGHAIVVESIKYESTDSNGVKTYSIKIYDNNYPGQDVDAKIRCGIAGCGVDGSNPDGTSYYFILGTRMDIQDTKDIDNIWE